ncbi:MAG: alpha/beta fold hydrolase [Syntrophaceae bacterium]|nr:alpha/beta fold hydrolase [Syntrophaceae bacterium]
MEKEPISWKSDGLTIRGEVYLPTHSRGPFPALILCHGIPAKIKGADDRGYPLLAERFCGEGFLVLIFNFRGAGLSEGDFDILGWARDLEKGLNTLYLRPEVNRERIFLMGFSGGAAVSIYVAARHREVSAVISCASPADFRDLSTAKGLEDFLTHAREVGIVKSAGFPQSMEGWKKSFKTVKPIDWIDRIPPRPLLLIHGTRDDVVGIRHAHRLYEKVKGKAELVVIEGAGHRLRVEEKAMEKALDWLKQLA